MASGQVTGLLRYIRQLVGTPDSGSINDPQLLRRYAENGDGDAFATLVQRRRWWANGPIRLVPGLCRTGSDAHDLTRHRRALSQPNMVQQLPPCSLPGVRINRHRDHHLLLSPDK